MRTYTSEELDELLQAFIREHSDIWHRECYLAYFYDKGLTARDDISVINRRALEVCDAVKVRRPIEARDCAGLATDQPQAWVHVEFEVTGERQVLRLLFGYDGEWYVHSSGASIRYENAKKALRAGLEAHNRLCIQQLAKMAVALWKHRNPYG